MKCPDCGLENPESAGSCDCGYVFKAAVETFSGPMNVRGRVVVTDFDMPFGSMVLFMVKWTIASIPALLILAILGFILSAIIAGIGGAFLR